MPCEIIIELIDAEVIASSVIIILLFFKSLGFLAFESFKLVRANGEA